VKTKKNSNKNYQTQINLAADNVIMYHCIQSVTNQVQASM